MTPIKAAEAAELYGDGMGADGDTAGAWTLVGDIERHDHYSRQSRWHDKYWLVVRDANGDDWGIEYGIGLTENQEDDLPWERVADDREFPLTRLYAHTVTKVEYRTKSAEVTA